MTLEQPMWTEYQKTWEDGNLLGIGTIEDISPNGQKIRLHETTQTYEWVDTVRRIRTFLGMYKNELRSRPDLERQMMGIMTKHIFNIVLADRSKLNIQTSLAEDLQQIVDQVDSSVKIEELLQSSFFNSEAPPILMLAILQLTAGVDTGQSMLSNHEYEDFKKGGVMLWVLTQGIFYGFARYLDLITRLKSDGYTEAQILSMVRTQIGYAGIKIEDDPNIKGKKITTPFVAGYIIDYLKQNISESMQLIFNGVVYDEMVVKGGTLKIILAEIVEQLANNNVAENIQIVIGANEIFEYRPSKDTHIWFCATSRNQITIPKI